MSEAALLWIAGDDTGLSSKAIWRHMMGQRPDMSWGQVDYPLDPDDFGRCYRLLLRVPEWRQRIGEMARYNAEWAALAAAWDELETMWAAEVGTRLDRAWGKSAPKLYHRIKEIERAVRVLGDEPKEGAA